MSFAVSDLPAKTYVAFFMSGLADVPGNFAAWYTMERFGRRNSMLGSLFMGGVCCTVTAFLPDGKLAFYQH